MNSNDCPPSIDPGNAFRVVVKCEKYSANLDYGVVPMCEQEHEIWFDRRSAYSLDKFINDMAAKIIWGRGQTLLVWGVDSDSCSEWKLTGNDQFKEMVQARWAERVVHLCVEVVDRDVNVAVGTAGSNAMVGSSGHGASAVTDADLMGDTCSSPDNVEPAYGDVDWSTLTIVPDAKTDGYMLALVDEDEVFEAMGFKAADDKVEEAVAEPYAIPVIPTELQDDMREAGIPVDDIDPDEPIWDWDRDNPDMSIQINRGAHTCASTSRVLGTMASQAWVAERTIPLLKKKTDIGAADVKAALEDKYKIQIPYQTCWYGRQRAADKYFGKWDDSFDWLYRFEAEIQLRAPGSVVEIDTIKVGDKRLTLEAPPEDQLPLSLPPPVKKLTPRKKQLATKIKKTPKKK
ncbi:unnamed protein product [Urochloa decumbens]|uniref:Uncharacterized protein n=1 Tax=Urochloa decumbens TaxID=240449 RepID=A0ABC9DBA0_9POAL